MACLFGNLETVKELVQQGADVDFKDMGTKSTPLHEAVIGGHEAIVAYLLSVGAKQTVPDSSGCLPLHQAAMQNEVGCVRLLLKADRVAAALVKKNHKGLVPLQVCVLFLFYVIYLVAN